MAPNFRELPEKIRIAAGEGMRAIADAPPARKMRGRINAMAQKERERIGRLAAPVWTVAHGWYSKREQREKVLLRALAAILGVIELYNFVYVPIAGLGGGFGDEVAVRE